MDALMIFDQAGIGSNNGEVFYICPSEKTFWFVFASFSCWYSIPYAEDQE
jgi:hypothetical protein